MTANEWDSAEATEPLLYGDAEAVAASGMPLPSLRVLQAAGAIQAQKTPKAHGGFKRMWSEEDVLISSIGTAISEHFAWNIRIVSEAIAKTNSATWGALTASIAGTSSPEDSSMIRSSEDDWHLDLINRQFLFLRVPQLYTAILPDVADQQTNLIIGLATSKDTFQMLPWLLGSPPGRAKLRKSVSPERMKQWTGIYMLAMAAHRDALSTASINISMHVRAAWRRLHKLDARFIHEALTIRSPNDSPVDPQQDADHQRGNTRR